MPDVDMAVRLLTTACTDNFAKLPFLEQMKLVDQFYNICDENKPLEFRKRTKSDIEKYLLSLNSLVRSSIEDVFECDVPLIWEDSKDNKVGSDLIVRTKYDSIVKDEKVELKFGKETLRAIGIKTFDKIFTVDFETGYFTEKFAEVKSNQRNFAEKYPGRFDDMIENLGNNLRPIIEEANQLEKEGRLVIDSHEMEAQLTGTGSVDSSKEVVAAKKLIVGWAKIEAKENPDFSGEWKIEEITPSKEDGARINFIASNDKMVAKFLLHWKNDMEYKGYKYPAKTGINSYCFNVWVWKK